LEDLAAEPDEQNSSEIGIGRIPPLGPLQYLESLARPRHAAAGTVNERDHAIDIWVVRHDPGAVERFRHEAGNGGRAVHAGEDADIVAGRSLAIGAAKTLECRARLDRQNFGRA